MKKTCLKVFMVFFTFVGFGLSSRIEASHNVSTFLSAKGAKAGLVAAVLASAGIYHMYQGSKKPCAGAGSRFPMPNEDTLRGFGFLLASIIPGAFALGQYYS